MDNKKIAERIKLAREERGITQKEVALYLGKQSSNAISEIERGNVNVTAEDIVKLSEMLNKPIMFFFGQDYPNDYTEDIFGVIQHLSPEEIDQLKSLAKSNAEQKAMAAAIQGDPNLLEDRVTVAKILQNLNSGIYALSNQLNSALEVRRQLESVLGIDEEPENYEEADHQKEGRK